MEKWYPELYDSQGRLDEQEHTLTTRSIFDAIYAFRDKIARLEALAITPGGGSSSTTIVSHTTHHTSVADILGDLITLENIAAPPAPVLDSVHLYAEDEASSSVLHVMAESGAVITFPDRTGTLVVGPSSSTDHAVARWDGTTGELLQDSSFATLSDAGTLTLQAASGAVVVLDRNDATITAGELLGSVRFSGTDGPNTGAQIDAYANEAWAGAAAGSYVVIATVSDGSTIMTERVRVKATGAVNVAGLTASRLMATDASKDIESVADLTAWIAGSGNINIVDDTDGTVTIQHSLGTNFVGGPASSTDHAVARWDGVTGALIQDTSTAILLDAGHLGLGVSPADKLHIQFAGGSTTALIEDTSANSLAGVRLKNDVQEWRVAVGTDDSFYLGDITAGTNPVRVVKAAPTDSLVILADGKVGVAETTPLAPFHVGGSSGELVRLADSSATGSPLLQMTQTTTDVAKLEYLDQGASDDQLRLVTNKGEIRLTTNIDSLGTDRVIVAKDGHVIMELATGADLRLNRSDSTIIADELLGKIDWTGDDNSGTGARIAGYAGAAWSASDFESYLTFSVVPSGSTTITEALRINSSGSAQFQDGRAQFQGNNNPPDGTGLEIGYNSGASFLVSYDRDLSAYKSLDLHCLDLSVVISTTEEFRITSAGVAQFLNAVQVLNYRGQFQGNTLPPDGVGVEVGYDGSGFVLAYDRDVSAYKDLELHGLEIDFFVEASQEMILDATGLGIGETSPAVRLHVGGSSGELLRLDDSSATGSPFLSWFQSGTRRSYIQHADSGDELLLNSEYGQVGLLSEGTRAFTVDIGTTIQFDARFDDNSNAIIRVANTTSGTAASAQLRVDASAGTVGLRAFSAGYTTSGRNIADGAILESDSNLSGGLQISSNAASSEIGFWVAGSREMTVDGTGLGIGTASPNQLLTVAAAAGPTIELYRDDATITVDELLGSLDFAGQDNSGVGARISGYAGGAWTATDFEAYLTFSVVPNDSTTMTEVMRLTSAGNVGIGTTTPLDNLTDGNYNYSSSFEGVHHSTASHARIVVEGEGSTAIDLIDTAATADEQWLQFVVDDGNAQFRSFLNSGGSQQANILYMDYVTGHVAIGDNAPPVRLLVGGDTGELLRLDDSSATGSPFLSFYQDGTQRSYIQHEDVGDEVRIVSNGGAVALFSEGARAFTVDRGATLLVSAQHATNSHVIQRIVNTDGGTAAATQMRVDASGGTVALWAFGAGYTTSGRFIQDGALLESDANLSGGLQISSNAASSEIGFWVAASRMGTFTGTGLEIEHATGATLQLNRADTGITTDDLLGQIDFTGDDESGIGARIAAYGAGSWSTDSESYLTIATTASGATTPTERLRINSEGDVGIGTTAPLDSIGTGGAGPYNYTSAAVGLHVYSAAAATVVVEGTSAAIDLIDHDATADDQWVRMRKSGGAFVISGRTGDSSSIVDAFQLDTSNGSIQLRSTTNAVLTLRGDTATSDVHLEFDQETTRRSYIEHADAGDNFKVVSEYGPVSLWPGASGTEVQTFNTTTIAVTSHVHFDVDDAAVTFGRTSGATLDLNRDDSTIIADELLGSISFSGDDNNHTGAYIDAYANEAWDATSAGTYIRLSVVADGESAVTPVMDVYADKALLKNDSAGGFLELHRNSGTIVADEVLGFIDFTGQDSTGTGARIATHADSAWAASDTPAYLAISVTPDGSGSLTECLRIHEDGLTEIKGATGEAIRLADSSLTGSPSLTFYQQSNARASITYVDVGPTLDHLDITLNNSNATGGINIESGYGPIALLVDSAGTPASALVAGTDGDITISNTLEVDTIAEKTTSNDVRFNDPIRVDEIKEKTLSAQVKFPDGIISNTLTSESTGITMLNSSGTILGQWAENPGDKETSLSVRMDISGTESLEQVTLGVTDSGGTGYRVLRVPNS